MIGYGSQYIKSLTVLSSPHLEEIMMVSHKELKAIRLRKTIKPSSPSYVRIQ